MAEPQNKITDFVQPALVQCVTCSKNVSVRAVTCGNCSEPDPAILKDDPQKRTQARKAWDESEQGKAWTRQQQEQQSRKHQKLAADASWKRAQKERIESLAPYYHYGIGLSNVSIAVGLLSAVFASAADKPAVYLVTTLSIAGFFAGRAMRKHAEDGGYEWPGPFQG